MPGRGRLPTVAGMSIKPLKAVVATMIATLALTLAPPAGAASAAPGAGLPAGEVVCFGIWRGEILLRIKCIVFKPLLPDCLKCDVLVLDPRVDVIITERLVDGFTLLDKAAHTTNPGQAASLRKLAQETFTSIATATPQDAVVNTGFIDRKTGKLTPSATPRLVEAGADIDAGLGYLRLAAQDPDGDPVLPALGMQRFDEAYRGLANAG